MITGSKFEASAGRRDSRKRRRLSERRRVFGRIGLAEQQLLAGGSLSSERTWSQQSSAGPSNAEMDQQFPLRSDSPLGDNSKISMKIQFHITVAPDNEPLLLDASQLNLGQGSPAALHGRSHGLSSSADALADQRKQLSTESSSIGEQIHERLNRQNTLSTRRRQQLLALHNQSALDNNATGKTGSGNNTEAAADEAGQHLSNSLPEQLSASPPVGAGKPLEGGREQGERSSTITGGMADQDTVRFLALHRQVASAEARPSQGSLLVAGSEREHIYFKRDGQRFGHEFTLKLSTVRTYRCLLKVRPLIPLQAISIQGHQVILVDCSHSASGGSSTATVAGGSQSAPSSALASSANLNRSWNNIHHSNIHCQQETSTTSTVNQRVGGAGGSNYKQHRLNHAQTSTNLNQNKRQPDQSQFLYQQQQSQMMRHFAASHCSSSSSAHLGSQLIYMFDWSTSRFDVNKNKARTQIQTVLKFKNGQILSLPLQVKFYQPDSKQHLSWGSQLHFIDYDCNINNMGQINVERIHYY